MKRIVCDFKDTKKNILKSVTLNEEKIEDVNLNTLTKMREELKANSYHLHYAEVYYEGCDTSST